MFMALYATKNAQAELVKVNRTKVMAFLKIDFLGQNFQKSYYIIKDFEKFWEIMSFLSQIKEISARRVILVKIQYAILRPFRGR